MRSRVFSLCNLTHSSISVYSNNIIIWNQNVLQIRFDCIYNNMNCNYCTVLHTNKQRSIVALSMSNLSSSFYKINMFVGISVSNIVNLNRTVISRMANLNKIPYKMQEYVCVYWHIKHVGICLVCGGPCFCDIFTCVHYSFTKEYGFKSI